MPDFVEKRAASAVATTASVLPGTLLNVPAALPSGPVPDHPVVAVNTQDWYTSISFWGSLIGFPVLDAVSEYLIAGGQFDKNRLFHIALSAALGAYLAYRRKTINTVLR